MNTLPGATESSTATPSSSSFEPRPGALRYKDANGQWQHANPRDLMYSTVTMLATEYWEPQCGWKLIHKD